jgi:hypothetical protein
MSMKKAAKAKAASIRNFPAKTMSAKHASGVRGGGKKPKGVPPPPGGYMEYKLNDVLITTVH